MYTGRDDNSRCAVHDAAREYRAADNDQRGDQSAGAYNDGGYAKELQGN